MPNPVRVQLHPNPDDQSWNVTLPPGARVVDYALTLDEGRAMLSLVLPVDSVHVGEVPGTTAQVRTTDEQQAARTVWGKPGPDPREQIPGWKPEPSTPPAHDATENDGAALTVAWAPGTSGDPLLDSLRNQIKTKYRGDARTAFDDGSRGAWSLTNTLLARIEAHLAAANWQRDGKKGRQPRSVQDRLRDLGFPLDEGDDDGLAEATA